MATIRFSNGAVVNFNGTPTQEDIEEIARKIKAQPSAQPETKTEEKPGFFKRTASFIAKDIFGGGDKSEGQGKAGEFGKTLFRSTVGSEGLAGVAQMPGKVIGQSGLSKDKKALDESRAGLADQTTALIKLIREVEDPERKARLQTMVDSNLETLGMAQGAEKELEEQTLTPRDTISTSANAALFGALGTGKKVSSLAIQGAKALPVGSKAASSINKAATVGNKVIPRAIEQGAISTGFSMSSNIRDSRPLMENAAGSFAFGMALPFAGTAASKVNAAIPGARLKASERIVNSLIKPLLKDFSYGKNPGRGVAREGLVFNNLEEGFVKISERLNSIGKQMDSVAQTHKNEVLDLSGALNPIDEAIARANFAPRVNANLISRLEDAKKDLLQMTTDLSGAEVAGRDLSNMTFKEALEFKRLIGDITKFTGNASDDALVNSSLKQTYGRIKEQLNKVAPEGVTLNERWADLKSAQIAVKYRDKIEARQNLIKFAPKLLGGGLGAIGITTFNPALIASAVLAYGADELLSSAAFKTRLAAWLAKSSAKQRSELIRNLPFLKNVFDRIFGEKRSKPLSADEIKKALDDLPAGLSTKDVSGFVKVRVNGKEELIDVPTYKIWAQRWDEDGTPYQFIERLDDMPKGAVANKIDDPLTASIAKAKAEGKSFEEFAKKDFQNKIIAGQDLADEIGKKVNIDGTITLYHGTSKQNADKILKTGIFNDGSYFSVKKTGTQYGDSPLDVARRKFGKDGTVIEIKVDARELESAAAGSEVYAPAKLIKQEDGSWVSETVKTKSQLKQLWDEN
jgi:hypothetical protein